MAHRRRSEPSEEQSGSGEVGEPITRIQREAVLDSLDRADEVIVIADPTGRILFANAAIERTTGCPRAELIGRHFVVALAEQDDPTAYEPISEAVGRGATWTGELPLRLPDGSSSRVQVVAVPLSHGGAVDQVVAISRRLPSTSPQVDGGDRSATRPRSGPLAVDDFVAAAAIGPHPEGGARRTAPAGQSVRATIEWVLRNRAFFSVYQPIVRLGDGATIGFEALTRFQDGRPPGIRFAEAAAVGLGLDLEIETLGAALSAAGELPPDRFLSVNVSPALVLNRVRLERALRGVDRPVVLEITEREPIGDYAALRSAISRIVAPVRWAIDDAGAGYASLRHVIELRPQFVKLDRELIAGVALDPARQALIAGLLHFSAALGTTLIGEGIETAAERIALHRLGVVAGQGWFLGRPSRIGLRVESAD